MASQKIPKHKLMDVQNPRKRISIEPLALFSERGTCEVFKQGIGTEKSKVGVCCVIDSGKESSRETWGTVSDFVGLARHPPDL